MDSASKVLVSLLMKRAGNFTFKRYTTTKQAMRLQEVQVFFPPSDNNRLVKKKSFGNDCACLYKIITCAAMQKRKNPDTEHFIFFRTTVKKFADVTSKQLQVSRVYSFLTMCCKINTLPVWMQTGRESDSKR